MNTSVEPHRLVWEGEMSIYRAQELKQALLDPLLSGVPLEVNLSAVTELDTVGVQLLLLAHRTAQKNQGSLRLLEPSAVVQEVLELLRLTALLDADTAAPPALA